MTFKYDKLMEGVAFISRRGFWMKPQTKKAAYPPTVVRTSSWLQVF